MPSNNSRSRSVIPGKAILGSDAAVEAALRTTVTGSVVPGRAILGDEGASVEKAKHDAAIIAERERAAAELARAGRKPVARPKAATAAPLPPDVAPGTPKKKAAVEKGLSEAEAIASLEADPDGWPGVLDLESDREGGVRPAIAAAIVRLAPKMVEEPLSEPALVMLSKIAGQAAPQDSSESAAPATAGATEGAAE